MNSIKSYIISLLLSVIFLIAYFITDNYIFLGISIFLVIAFIFSPWLRNKTELLLIQSVFLIIKSITWILLGIIYLFMLIPIARLQRFFTQNPIILGRNSQETYFVPRNHIFRSRDLEKPW